MDISNRKLKAPSVDLKKKPTHDLLKLIAKQSASDITPHVFSKVKPPRDKKIEEIFIKSKKKLKKKSK